PAPVSSRRGCGKNRPMPFGGVRSGSISATARPRNWGWTSREKQWTIAYMSGRQAHGDGLKEPEVESFVIDFDVVSVSRDDEVIVALRGEVDLATAPLLERELALGPVQE